MPAPQSSSMKQFARLKFTSFSLKVPTNFQAPSGDPDAQQYSDAFQPSEKSTAPGSPPLFQAASANKYHTDTQKMHIAKVGKFIDDTCAAICSAWSQWQQTATMAGLVVTGPSVMGGIIPPIPLTPLILASAPMGSPMQMKYSTAIATVIGIEWTIYTTSIKITGFPAFPAYAANPPGPAVPCPNVPIPLATLVQMPPMAAKMKQSMVAMLGDPMAPFHGELFEAICDGFDKCFQIWQKSTTIQNLTVIGANPSPLTPGPVVGTAIMPPGGFV
jgi:hypothetical protein